MHFIVIVSVVGLALCGWLAVRHAVRTTVTVPPVSDPLAPSSSKPMDAWQSGIKPDTRTEYAPDLARTKCLMEKLRQEELRQRPQEGRN